MVFLGSTIRALIRAARPMRCGRSVIELCVVPVILAASGCVGPRTIAPAVNADELSDDGFQVYLAETELITVGEAYRAMLILADGEDTCRTFEERREKLESRGIANAKWGLQPENVVDTGAVACMVCKICEIRGGVCANLFGSWGLGDRRYALRELIYREMVDESVDYQYVTGPSLLALMAKADELMEKKGLYETQTIDLTDEADRDEKGDLIVPRPIAE